MLAHILFYFAFTALHLFSGVSAATIGLPGRDSHNLGSSSAVQKRDDGEQQEDQDNGDDEGPADAMEEIEDVLPHATKEEMIMLMTQIPDEILEEGSDATEDWLREHIQQLQDIVTRDADPDDELEQRWLSELWQIAKCAGGIAWLIAQNMTAVSKVAKIGKIWKLKEAIDDVGGYKKAAKILMTNFTKKKGKHRAKASKQEKLASLAYQILGANVVASECPKVF